MSFWKDNLKNRVPEYYETGDDLVAYLEVCGEAFDELSDSIKSIDDFKDYKKCPTTRLSLLSYRFNFNTPAAIPEALMRGICRDLAFINRTNGTFDSIKWVFRLLNWDVNYRFAWLPAPERFEPKLLDIYMKEYLGEGETGVDITDSFIPVLGQPYNFGIPNQEYHGDPTKNIDGFLKLGSADYGTLNSNDPNSPSAISKMSTDAGKISERNFLYGDAVILNNGVYLYGRGINQLDGSEQYFRILGEQYGDDANRTEIKVMSTPYLLVEIDETDYFNFTAPYVGEDGEDYDYTNSEAFRTTEILINYLLHQYVRPSNVRILTISTTSTEHDGIVIESDFIHSVTGEGMETSYEFEMSESEEEIFTVDTELYPLLYGDTPYAFGAPTVQPINSLSAVTPPLYGDTQIIGPPVLGTTEFDVTYSLDIDTEDGGGLPTDPGTPAGVYYLATMDQAPATTVIDSSSFNHIPTTSQSTEIVSTRTHNGHNTLYCPENNSLQYSMNLAELGDFTIAFDVYLTAIPFNVNSYEDVILQFGTANAGGDGFLLGYRKNTNYNAFQYRSAGTGNVATTPNNFSTTSYNRWTSVEVVYTQSSETIRVYADGIAGTPINVAGVNLNRVTLMRFGDGDIGLKVPRQKWLSDIVITRG